MEFTLDVPLIREVLSREYALASSDIRSLGASRALERSLQRQDRGIAGAADAGTLACRAGCSWCCYFTVDVRPAEVFAILDFMERTLSPDERIRIQSEIRANSAMLRGLTEDARVTRNVKCPFLAEGRCSIYQARPQSCRNYHATDAAGCEKSYENPEDLDIDPEFAPAVYQVGGAHVQAFAAAMRDAGFDVDAYELNSALDTALSEAGARERFEARRKPFIGIRGEEVFDEFEDLDP
jgi:Fe-S-cluster containining protein